MSCKKKIKKPIVEIITKTVTTLYSEIYEEPKAFYSIFKCKHKKPDPPQFSPPTHRETFISMGQYGPLICKHNTMGKKIVSKPRKHHFDDLVKVKPYRYLEQHAKCKETQLYWLDQQHPQILRHYSRDKITPKNLPK